MKTLSFKNFKVARQSRLFFDLDTEQDRVSFEPGLHLLLAPNGLGKSTFLQACSGLLADTQGDLFFDGRTVTPASSVFYLSEYLTLPKFITGEEWASSYGEADLKWVNELRLNDVWKKYLGRMSQGERRKIMWLSAHFSKKSILFLDEPLDGLDLRAIDAARGLINAWKAEGRVVLLVAHQTGEIADLATQAWVIENQKWADWSSIFKTPFSGESASEVRTKLLGHYR